jgi:nitroreductase
MMDAAEPGSAAPAQPDHRPDDGTGGLSRDELVACVSAATAAPSLHNSQPWRFRCRDGGVDVYADWRRQLQIVDPVGRGLLMSVGAAIFNLRLAVYSRSWEPATQVFPDHDDPELVARVCPGQPMSPDADLAALAQAIPRRHTNRLPFAPTVVPREILEKLATAARSEGAHLRLAGPATRTTVLSLREAAERRLRMRGTYRADATTLARGTRTTPTMPPRALGPWEALEAVPLRDFGLRQPELLRQTGPDVPYPTIAILATAGDAAAEWVGCGQALQRTLLLATVHGLAATPASQPLEEPELRELMAEPGDGRWPQLVLQLGYAPPGAPASRRPLKDVLLG